MTVLITLSGVGSNTGPTFNLYSSPDGTTYTPIILGIDKTLLQPGYTINVPDGTTSIKVTSVGQCANSEIATIVLIPASIICGSWNSITGEEYMQSGTGSWAYDADGNEYWAEDPGTYYQLLKITGGSRFDFYKLFLPGEIIDTALSTARVLSYTTQAQTYLIANASELPTPDPQWEGVLHETIDTNTIYKYVVASNTWVPVPYGQETTTYNVDGYNWNFNFDYTPPYIGTLGDPELPSVEYNQGNNINPILTMTLGGNLVTTGGRVIPINETSTYTSILQVFESESTGCQNFTSTISGNLCGYWTSNVSPNTDNTENMINGYIDFSSWVNGETIDPTASWVRVRSLVTLYGGGSTIPNDSSGDLTFNEFNNRGYIGVSSIVVYQVDDPSAAMTLYFEGYIRTYEGTFYSLFAADTYSNRTSMNGNNSINECPS
jgi:hypothetical protein